MFLFEMFKILFQILFWGRRSEVIPVWVVVLDLFSLLIAVLYLFEVGSFNSQPEYVQIGALVNNWIMIPLDFELSLAASWKGLFIHLFIIITIIIIIFLTN